MSPANPTRDALADVQRYLDRKHMSYALKTVDTEYRSQWIGVRFASKHEAVRASWLVINRWPGVISIDIIETSQPANFALKGNGLKRIETP